MKKNVPNILSVCRIFISIIMFIFMLIIDPEENRLLFILVPGLVFGAGCLTDMLDGKIARKYDIVSEFGMFVDPIGDKVLTMFAMLAFVYIGVDKKFPFMLITLAATMFREFVVSSVRMVCAQKGKVVAANFFGKLKTVFQMAALILYFLLAGTKYIFVAQIVVSIAATLTILSGMTYVSDLLKMMKEEKK